MNLSFLWNKIANWIVGTGENLLFVYFMAHAGIFAFLVLLVDLFATLPVLIWFVVACYVLTAIKEFWFDMKYEKNPPQSLLDSERDFAGYFVGISVGLIVSVIKYLF